MNKQEAITKLTELDGILDEYIAERKNIENNILAKESLNNFHAIKRKTGALSSIPEVFSKLPKYNYTYYNIDNSEEKLKNLNIKRMACGGAMALFFLLFMVTHVMFLGYIFVALIFATIYFFNEYKKENKEMTKNKNLNLETKERQEREESAWLEALKVFEAQKVKGMQAALEYKIAAEKGYAESCEELNRYGIAKQESYEKQDELKEKINSYDFVPSEYLHLVGPILSLLKSGRADDYKEALNMAIAEERDEEERAQRAEEERRRTQLMERQAEEERRHNMKIEAQQEAANRAQAEHNRAMEDAERKRAQTEASNARLAREQAERDKKNAEYKERSAASQQRAAAYERCKRCINYGKCGVPVPNCAAFRPRR